MLIIVVKLLKKVFLNNYIKKKLFFINYNIVNNNKFLNTINLINIKVYNEIFINIRFITKTINII